MLVLIFLFFLGSFIFLILIFSYCWAVIIFRLFGTDSKRDKIIRFFIYIAIFYFAFSIWGFFIDIFIILWIKDFKSKAIYFRLKWLLGNVIFALSIPVFVYTAWQINIPQNIFLNIGNFLLNQNGSRFEIVDKNFSKESDFSREDTREFLLCNERGEFCPLFSLEYPIFDIYAEYNGTKKNIAKEYAVVYKNSYIVRLLKYLMPSNYYLEYSVGDFEYIKFKLRSNQ